MRAECSQIGEVTAGHRGQAGRACRSALPGATGRAPVSIVRSCR